MSKRDNGGFAYPSGDATGYEPEFGITRRDQCADRIAAAIISNESYMRSLDSRRPKARPLEQCVARESYRYADAMIAEGNKL